MRPGRFDDALDRLAAQEEEFLRREFLAPVVEHGQVQVRIAGVVCRLAVTPADFQGWGVFRPRSHAAAELVKPATLAQRRQYLKLFPLVRLILTLRDGKQWLALAAHRGDARLRLAGLAPVRLVEEAQAMEVIRARFDGANFWFEGSEPSRDPATAAYLRQQLRAKIAPNLLDRPGLTPEERAAYDVCYQLDAEVRKAKAREVTGDRLRSALAHAGAEFVDYLERGDSYRVTYTLGGQQHVSAVRKSDLTVQVAGICLSGEDENFDLTSLVGVLREAGGGGLPIGDGGVAEEDYWRIHPRPRR